MKKNKLAVFGIVAILCAAAGIYFGMQRHSPSTPQNDAISSLLSQSLPDVNGAQQSLSKWKGKALIVNFWATWCAPCVDEMPELSALQGELASSNIQIIGIGIDSAVNIAQFAAKYKINYPLYTAGMGASEITRQLGNQASGLPFTVLVGRDGEVKKTYLGRLKMQQLRKDLALL